MGSSIGTGVGGLAPVWASRRVEPAPAPQFRSTIRPVVVLSSALRHGIDVEDIQHALVHALTVDEIGEDPLRYLVLGPDRAANLLELVVLDRPHGPAVIHAMTMRDKYRRLLPGGR
jgi:hypothetical protein